MRDRESACRDRRIAVDPLHAGMGGAHDRVIWVRIPVRPCFRGYSRHHAGPSLLGWPVFFAR